MCVDSLGQGKSLHVELSVLLDPLAEQSLPPNWGGGLLQRLSRLLMPPPQEAEQGSQDSHCPQTPSTGMNE